MTRPPRSQAGLTAIGAGIIAAIIAAVGIGSYYTWSVFEATSAWRKAEQELINKITSYRGSARITKARIQARAVKVLTGSGAQLAASDVKVVMEPLGKKNQHKLNKVQKKKLRLECRVGGVAKARERKLDLAGMPAGTDLRSIRRRARLKSAARVEQVSEAYSCATGDYSGLGYTFVSVSARFRVEKGWSSKQGTASYAFYLRQSPDGDGDDDDEDGDDDQADDDE